MENLLFQERLKQLKLEYKQLTGQSNPAREGGNGVFLRHRHPVLTSAHAPLEWRYDLHPGTNPFLMERFGINAVLNAGAILLGGSYLLVARVEGADRKSFFAVAESKNGIEHFKFWDTPVVMPETASPDINVYDMRLVKHEDGWVYGLFCTERKDPAAPAGDTSSAIAQCGIARTKDLKNWKRLADLTTPSNQQRNVVLHPEFINGRYAFYTRPQDSFLEAGKGGGIGFGLSDSIEHAVVNEEIVIDPKVYHTVYELKNGLGPAPLKTPLGWLHLAHGVRNTAAGLRYVLYLFMTDLADPSCVIHKPGGYFMAPEADERVGDVSNVLFCNGWILNEDGRVFIYYASSDTRVHVATTTLQQLLDYTVNTPPDSGRSANSVNTIMNIINSNRQWAQAQIPASLQLISR